MALNHFTDEEAIEIVIDLRQELPLDLCEPIPERWKTRDALAHVINRLKEYKEKYGELNED